MTGDINEVPGASPSLRTELGRRLEELVPEAIADGKVDVAKLQELLADDSADDSERFGLFWPGKKRALRTAQEPTTATLRPVPGESKDWDTTQNVFIEGDNLEVLKILQRKYHNKIKMIYVDPPYNTGKDFIYPDNYREGLQSYLEFTGQVDGEGRSLGTNSDTDGRYHSNWLNMMYPRLKLARNLLTDDGLLFVSIDDHEYDNLKKLCDLVFGEANYVNTFVWVSNLKGRQITGSGAAGTKEYVLCYSRRIEEVGDFRTAASVAKALMPTVYKGFNYKVEEDEAGSYVLKNELYNTNSAFNEVTRPNLVYDIYFNPTTRDVKTSPVSPQHEYEDYAKISPKTNNDGVHKYHAFRWSTKKVESESHDLEFVDSPNGYKVFTKVRDVDSTTLKDLIMDINTSAGSGDIEKIGLNPRYFDYPKPVDLIKLLCSIGSAKDSLVLDFFSGSGTTAHAIMQLNAEDGGIRGHIQVQLPEPTARGSEAHKAGFKTIADVGRRRIDLAGEKIKADVEDSLDSREIPLDIGFRTYKLVDTNFSKWRVASDIGKDDLQQRLLDLRESSNDAATEEDLLAEILLKQGYSLSEHTENLDIAGLSTWRVGSGDLIAYLNEHVKPTLDQLRELAGSGASRLVIVEDAFHGDDELKTNLAQLCKTNDVELWTA